MRIIVNSTKLLLLTFLREEEPIFLTLLQEVLKCLLMYSILFHPYCYQVVQIDIGRHVSLNEHISSMIYYQYTLEAAT